MQLSSLLATRRFPIVAVIIVVVGLPVLSACSSSSGGTTGGEPPSSGQSGQPSTQASSQAPSAAPKSAPASSQPAAKAMDACSLLTKAEAEAATGAPVLEPKREEFEERASCLFNDPKAPSSDLVRIDVVTYSTVGGAKLGFEAGKGLNSAAGVQAVTGLGDDAYWADFVGILQILKGNYEIRLRITTGEKPDRRNMAQGLATKALTRLPQ